MLRRSFLKRRTPLKRSGRLNPISTTRKSQNVVYFAARKEYLSKHKFCECCKFKRAAQIHHKAGRVGSLLTDKRYFMAVCAMCHRWIHDNPKQAKELKMLV